MTDCKKSFPLEFSEFYNKSAEREARHQIGRLLIKWGGLESLHINCKNSSVLGGTVLKAMRADSM